MYLLRRLHCIRKFCKYRFSHTANSNVKIYQSQLIILKIIDCRWAILALAFTVREKWYLQKFPIFFLSQIFLYFFSYLFIFISMPLQLQKFAIFFLSRILFISSVIYLCFSQCLSQYLYAVSIF